MAKGAFWKSEADRWPLWLPVALGAGAGLYFALGFEPSAATGWLAGAAALAALMGALWLPHGRIVLALIAALALGFASAKARTERVAAPILEREIVAHLTGRVVSVDPAAKGARLVIGDLRSGAFRDVVPQKARIAVRSGFEAFKPGDGIGLTAQLMPPPGPATPGDGDFARAAFYQGIGAVGFSFGAPLPAPLAQDTGWRIAEAIENFRERMTARIQKVIGGSTGAIASAMITGQRGGIDEDDDAALRDAGLAHVLSISGLHMAMVGLGMFWLVRAVLAAFPYLALNYPIKKWAALAALAGAAFYLVISGLSAPANRSFVMLAMMLTAILFDRPALTMRNLGLAAAILILWHPETVTEPGFQMSFAAVAGLVAVAEWESQRQLAVPHGMVIRYLRGIAVTSLVGSIATLPFALFYFERANHYAVLGNLLAMPVVGFVVMPAAALSVIAMPFGAEALPLKAMGWGLEVMIAAGRFVSGLPGVVSVTHAFPIFALIAVVLGGCWLLIWRGAKRWLGFAPILAGIVLAFVAPRPDILVAEDALTIAVRGEGGFLMFARPPRDNFAASRWLQRDGDKRTPRQATGGARCDVFGCVSQVKDQVIAMPQRREALADDCARADILIAALPVTDCKGPKQVLDSKAIAFGGGYAITNGKALSVRQSRGERPWVR